MKWIAYIALVAGLIFQGVAVNAAPTLDGIARTATGKTRFWKAFPIRICVTSSIPRDVATDLSAAAAAWNGSFKKAIFETGCVAKTTTFDTENTKEHSIFLVTNGFGKTRDPLALARTLSSFDEETGEMLDADILLNAESFDWKKLKVDLKSILIHELGHVLGLQHLSISSVSVMNQYPYQSGIVRHKLGPYEIAAIQRKYFGAKEPVPSYIDPFFSGDFPRTLLEFRKLKRLSSDENYAVGMLELASKNFDSAIVALQKCLEQDPKNVMAQYRLADALNRKGMLTEAETTLKAVLSAHPEFYEALADLALIRFNQGNNVEARQLFEKTLEINPVHYPACHFLLKLTGEKKYEDCLKRFAPAN